MADVIKHGAITVIDYFRWLEANICVMMNLDTTALVQAIMKSCAIKAAVVAEDEREQGRRAILNFGHTFGHAIEMSMGYGKWLHGEAVAVGMLMAASLSGIDSAEQDRLKHLIVAAGLPTEPPPAGAEQLASAMRIDKKVIAKRLRFVLLRRLGEAFVTTDYDEARLAQILATADTARSA